MKVKDFFNSLEADRIKILISPQNSKIRGLASSFFRFKIPLEPTPDRTTLKAIEVRPKVGNTDRILVGLFWEAFFGKKFKVIHWHILLQVLLATIKKDRTSEALLALLCIMTANAATSNWSSNMVPLRTILFRTLEKEQAQNLLEYFLSSIPVSLPRKRPVIENLISVNLNGTIKQRSPKELARIGVGYKDKGNLSLNQGVEPLASEDFVEIDHTFDDLLRQVKYRFKRFIT
jgi:hypothetical protein